MGSSKKQKNEPFVSILTPVYNSEKYLEACIESVLNQTYENWEYVIVNNGSTDDSLSIARKYAEMDSRIRIHNNKEFLPQMENLNHTFRQISPESTYCKVIHADDMLFPECVGKMVALAEKYPSIGFVGAYQLIGKKSGPNYLEFPQEFFPGKEFAKRYLLNDMKLIAHPSSNLIRSDLIRKRQQVYDERYVSSDTSAFLDILNESDFGFVHQILTFTRLHDGSVTSSVKKYMYMLDRLRINLKHAPAFLPEEQAKRVIKRRERLFYIQFARSLIFGDTKEVYSTLAKELQSINVSVKYGKLFLHFIRELLLQPVKALGFKK